MPTVKKTGLSSRSHVLYVYILETQKIAAFHVRTNVRMFAWEADV